MNDLVNANLYKQITEILINARNQTYRAANSAMVAAYWQIGKSIVERQGGADRADYGTQLITELSKKLTEDFGKGFDERNLRNMRAFYLAFPIWNTVCTELTWSHYRTVLRVENEAARNWYIQEAISQSWSVRQLDRQISTLYYDRLLASRDKTPVEIEASEKLKNVPTTEFIKDPYVLEFLGLNEYPSLRESEIEQALIDNLQNFLLDLGKGFCFVARQKRMRYDDEDFYIDLVFYNSILKCHVLIDLKIGKLTHQDIGQMDSYIRMFDALYKNEDDNPTLGIILCSEKSEAIVKYSVLNDKKNIFASKYQFTLPSEEELQNYIVRERRLLEQGSDNK